MADKLPYTLDYNPNDVLKAMESSLNVSLSGERIIGKLPGYNGIIDPTGKYRMKMLENMTVVRFKPIAYKMDWKGTWNNIKNKKAGALANLFTSVENSVTLHKWTEMLTSNGLDPTEDITIIGSNDSSINESISSSYRDNMISDTYNSFAEKIRASKISEFVKISGASDTKIDGADAALGSIANNYANDSGFGGIADIASSLTKGYNLNMPKIWGSSQYNSQMNLTIKLNSPYGDPEAIMEYILKPIMYLFALAAPVTSGDGLLSGTPFLFDVKAAGLMHMKLAAVSNIMITRGGPDTVFNIYGQPTAVEVRLTIIPIVPGYAMAADKDAKEFMYGGDLRNSGKGTFVNNPISAAASMMNNKFKL